LEIRNLQGAMAIYGGAIVVMAQDYCLICKDRFIRGLFLDNDDFLDYSFLNRTFRPSPFVLGMVDVGFN
jgi:hypothetical protein